MAGRSFLQDFSKKYMWDAQLEMGSGGEKIYQLKQIINYLYQKNPLLLLSGLGPGMYSSTAGSYFKAPLFLKLTGGRISSQLITTIGEFGFIGLLLFYLLWIKILRQAILVFKKEMDPLFKSLSFGLIGATMFMIIGGPVIQNVWEIRFIAFYFWFLAGLTFSARKKLDYCKARH